MAGLPLHPSDEQVRELAEKYFDGTVTPAESEQLEKLLLESAAAREIYLRYGILQGQLHLLETARYPSRDLPDAAPVAEHSRAREQVSNVDSQRRTAPERREAWWPVVGTVLAVMVLVGWAMRSGPDSQVVDQPVVAPQVDGPEAIAAENQHYSDFEPPVAVVGTSQKSSTSPEIEEVKLLASTTISVSEGSANFQSLTGTAVELLGPTRYGVVSSQSGVLFGGVVQTENASSGSSYSVQASDLRIVDRASKSRVTALENCRIDVEALNGEIEVEARRRRPIYFWNFENQSPGLPDVVSQGTLILGSDTKVVPGIIGNGALSFANSKESYAIVEGGKSQQAGEGRFACAEGITIEAMFISHWNGEKMDYDEIFRKEDGNFRVILSFQNDDQQERYSKPMSPPGPSLAFGLYLEGDGYTELEVLLDGEDGRPALADLSNGQPHHVVATFDSFTGRKGLYVDGRLLAEYQFPKGTLIRCGGPGEARIGNQIAHEPFHGIIDELAYYDFGLTEAEIQEHYARVQRGESYFAEPESELQKPHWHLVGRLLTGQRSQFDCRLGLQITVPEYSLAGHSPLTDLNTIPSTAFQPETTVLFSPFPFGRFSAKDSSNVSEHDSDSLGPPSIYID
ncbi:LamG-like jellyroll fold domain-containing protein [Planctomicrobium sp. SH661]|uniref:LamG-like jellyroll fold domain-containing protein n=1 Tax=Planctomicrobium sp. SH661 TaxID=3448124 RepID=UPI003F5C1B00